MPSEEGVDVDDQGNITAPDGTRVAWKAQGEGAPLVFCNGLANDAFQWGTVLARLRGPARLITWDYPGHGDSEPARTAAAVDIPALVTELGQVVDAAAGPDRRVVMMGYSLGCQVALASWGALSSRIGAMVCALGTPGKPFDTFYGPVLGRVAHGLLRATPARVLGAALKAGSALGPVSFYSSQLSGTTERGIRYREFAPWLEHMGRLDARSFKAMSLAAQQHTAEDLLGSITVPTLVVAGGTDVFTPPDRARAIDAALPDSELVFLPGASHAGLVGHGEAISDAIDDFLTRRDLLG